jgi:hypothetical protein
MRWAGYVARIEENTISNRGVMRIPEVRDYLEGSGLDGMIILKWALKR